MSETMNTPTKILAIVSVLVIALCVYSKMTEPAAELTHRGHKIPADPPVTVTGREESPGVWVSAVFTVTAYCAPCDICCKGANDGITASGYDVRNGSVSHFVAAPPEYPFGTVFIIPGYGSGPVVVLDRGGDIKGNRLDVYIREGHQAALEFGRQTITVQIWEQ